MKKHYVIETRPSPFKHGGPFDEPHKRFQKDGEGKERQIISKRRKKQEDLSEEDRAFQIPKSKYRDGLLFDFWTIDD